jgi:hypothetical protein
MLMDDEINAMARAKARLKRDMADAARDQANAQAAADRQAARRTAELRALFRQFARWANTNHIRTDYRSGMFGKRGWVLMHGYVEQGSKISTTIYPPFVVYTDGSVEYIHHGGPKYREIATENFLRGKTLQDVKFAISDIVEKTGVPWSG